MLTYMLVPMYKKKLDLEGAKLPQSKLILILHSLSIAPANDIKGKQQLSGVLGEDFNSYQRWYYDT